MALLCEERDGAQHRRARQVGAHQQRLSPDPVGQDADAETDQQVGRPPRCVDIADIRGRAVQVDHHEDPDGQRGDVGTEVRDRRCRPKPAKPRMATQA